MLNASVSMHACACVNQILYSNTMSTYHISLPFWTATIVALRSDYLSNILSQTTMESEKEDAISPTHLQPPSPPLSPTPHPTPLPTPCCNRSYYAPNTMHSQLHNVFCSVNQITVTKNALEPTSTPPLVLSKKYFANSCDNFFPRGPAPGHLVGTKSD